MNPIRTNEGFKWGIRLYSNLLNSLLILIAIFQGLLVLLVLFQKEIPLPEFVLRDLDRELDKLGIDFEVDKFTFDTSGRLYANNLQLFRKETRDLLLKSESVIIAFELPMLFLLKAAAEELEIRNAKLNCPSLYSLSGSEEAIAQRLNGSFVNTSHGWKIRQLSFFLHNLRLRIRGPLPEAILRGDKVLTPEMKEEPLKQFLMFCRSLSELQKPLSTLKDAHAIIRLREMRGFHPSLEVDLFGQGFHWPNAPQIGRFHVHAPRIDLLTLDLLDPIQIHADSLVIDGKIRTSLIRFLIEAKSIHKEASDGLFRAFFSSPNSYSPVFAETGLSGYFRLEKYPLVEGSVFVGLDGGPLVIKGKIDMERGTGRLSLRSEADLKHLKNIVGPSKYRFLKFFAFPKTSYLNADLTIDKSFSLYDANFSFSSDWLKLGNSKLSNLRMSGSFDPYSIRFRKIEFDQSGHRTEGSIKIDLVTDQIRTLLKGHLYPTQFNSLLPDWWAKTWKDFVFFGQPLRGDIEFQTNWEEGHLLFHYGAIAGKNLSYRGMDISEIRLNSWAIPGFFELFQIESKRPEGKAEGSMWWTFKEPTKMAGFLDITTQFHLANLSVLVGDSSASFVDDFEFSNPPLLEITGLLYNRDATPSNQRALRIKAESKRPFNYRMLSFDHLGLDGRLGSETFSSDSLSFGLAGGNGNGSLEWNRSGSASDVSLDLSLRGADSERLLEMIGLQESLSSTPTHGESTRSKPESSGGIVNLDLKAIGNPKDFLDFRGSGWLQMSQESLGKIHLFGGFSRLFYGSWIGFTTLRLERGEGYFLLDQNKISFPDLRFYGPNALVQARGDLLFPHHEIDFKVQVKYMERVINPIATALSPLFKPLIDSLEVELSGLLANPQWRFSVHPSNIFESPTFSPRPIGPLDGEEDEESQAGTP